MSIDESIKTIEVSMIEHNKADDVRFGKQGESLEKIEKDMNKVLYIAERTHEKVSETGTMLKEHERSIRDLQDWRIVTNIKVEEIVASKQEVHSQWLGWKFAVLLAIVTAVISSVTGTISAIFAARSENKALTQQVETITSQLGVKLAK